MGAHVAHPPYGDGPASMAGLGGNLLLFLDALSGECALESMVGQGAEVGEALLLRGPACLASHWLSSRGRCPFAYQQCRPGSQLLTQRCCHRETARI